MNYRELEIGEFTLPTDEFWCMVDYSTADDDRRHNKYRFEWREMGKNGVAHAPVVTEHTVKIRRKYE